MLPHALTKHTRWQENFPFRGIHPPNSQNGHFKLKPRRQNDPFRRGSKNPLLRVPVGCPPGGGNLGGPETLKERNLGWNAAELHGVGEIKGKLTSREPTKQPSGLAWYAPAVAPPETTRSHPDIVRFERGGVATSWSEGALPTGSPPLRLKKP